MNEQQVCPVCFSLPIRRMLMPAMAVALLCLACTKSIEATPTAMPCTETVLQETQTEIVLDLVQALDDESDSVRYDAMQQLLAAQTWIDGDTAEGSATITALIGVLENENLYAIRSNAVWVLGAIDTTGDRVIDPLIRALQEDGDGAVRIAAGRTLIRYIDQPSVLPALASAFESDHTVRWAIAERLGIQSPPEAIGIVPSLVRVLQEEEEEMVRSAIVRALTQITGQDFGQDSARWQQWLQDQPPAVFETPVPAGPSLPVIYGDVLPNDFGTLVLPVGDGALWLFVGGEAPRALARGERPDLSPDGCSVLLHRPNLYIHSELWVVDVDEAAPRRVFSGTQPTIYGLAWSPDSRGFAITTGGYAKRSYSDDLWWVDLVHGCATRIAEDGGGEPAFSPDGKWIATFTPEIGYTHGMVGLWRLSDLHGELVLSRPLYEHSDLAALVSKRTVFRELVWPREITWADDSTGFSVSMSLADDSGTRLWWVPVDGSAIEPLSSLSPTSPGPGQESQIGATYYVTSTTESGYTEFLYCRPDGPCHSLARLEHQIWRASYIDRRCAR